jgi:Flp pilus assembly protein TadD
MTYSRLGRLDRAIEIMQRLGEKDPANPMSHTNLSVFYMKQGLKEKAEEEKAKATVLQFARMAQKKKS